MVEGCPVCGEESPASDHKCPRRSTFLERLNAETAAGGIRSGVGAIEGKVSEGGHDLVALARDEGAELFAMVGLSQHGKSEFITSLLRAIEGYTSGDTRGQIEKIQKENAAGRIERTLRGNFFAWRIPVGSRLVVIWDIAGEDFRKLAEDLSESQHNDLRQFLERVLPWCQGIAMTIALHKLWAPWNPVKVREDEKAALDDRPVTDGAILYGTDKDRHYQLERNLGIYIRFIQCARVARLLHRRRGSAPDGYLGSKALSMHGRNTWKLDIPVFVNLSMADRLDEIVTPEVDAAPAWGLPMMDSRMINVQEADPLAFSFLHLRPLFLDLLTEARWFKFDYSRAYIEGRFNHGRVRDPRGCQSAFDFLARMNWRAPVGLSTSRVLRWYVTLMRRSWQRRVNHCVALSTQPEAIDAAARS